jgi:hypothetical protein
MQSIIRTIQPELLELVLLSIKHHQLNDSQNFLQATSVSIEDSVGHLTISAVYLRPKYTVKQEQL